MTEPAKITKPGFYFDMAAADYFADPCPEPSLTQSIAKVLIERSPAHARAQHPRLRARVEDDAPPEPYSAAKAIGDAAHRLMIGRGKVLGVGHFDAWTTKEAKKYKADALAAGWTPILEKHFQRAETLVESARAQIDAAGWKAAFRLGDGEVVIAWQEDGLWFRSMIDWLSDTRNVFDYKTTGLSVAPHAIPKLMVDAGWDVQAAFIERGLDVLDPDGRGKRIFRFIAQENEEPFALTPVELTEAVLTMGRKKVQFAVDRWRASMTSGEWPAYPSEICRPAYPGYREAQWLNREVEESDRRPSANKSEQLRSLMGG